MKSVAEKGGGGGCNSSGLVMRLMFKFIDNISNSVVYAMISQIFTFKLFKLIKLFKLQLKIKLKV